MTMKIVSTIPSAVWWIVAVCLLILTFAISIQILASDTVELSSDGVRMESAPAEYVDDSTQQVKQ